MRKPENKLFRIDKRASLIGITALLLISVASYFMFFNKKVSEDIEVEIIDITSLKLSILNGCGVKGARRLPCTRPTDEEWDLSLINKFPDDVRNVC